MSAKIPLDVFNKSSPKRILAAVYIMFAVLSVFDLVIGTFDIYRASVGKRDQQL